MFQLNKFVKVVFVLAFSSTPNTMFLPSELCVTQTTSPLARYVCLLLLFFHFSLLMYMKRTWSEINFHHFLFFFCVFFLLSSVYELRMAELSWYIARHEVCKYNVTMTVSSTTKDVTQSCSDQCKTFQVIRKSRIKEILKIIQMRFLCISHSLHHVAAAGCLRGERRERKENYSSMLSFCLGGQREGTSPIILSTYDDFE